jgi:TPR repeat protein
MRWWRLARRLIRALAIALGLVIAMSGAFADEGDYSPQNIAHTYSRLKWLCMIHALCPASDKALAIIEQVIANDRTAEYLLGLTLLVGDDLPTDRKAGIQWIAFAAERGDPDAARDIAARLRNGEAIEVDETKIATALKAQADAGDAESMRALGPMYIGGRGVTQDPAAGIDLLQRAAAKGSTGAEIDLSQLYLNGAPGVTKNRPDAMKWLATSANHGNVDAMVNLGYMSLNETVETGFCWLMRAALLDQVQAQEKLSLVFADGQRDSRGIAIAPDLVQADLWFRLAARSPYHDNSQIRAAIEPHMTTDQLNQAKRLFEAWHPRTLQEVRAMSIALPPAAQGNCAPMA